MATLTGANRHDVTQADTADRRHSIRAEPARAAPHATDRVYADRAYDHDKYRQLVRSAGIQPVIARRGTDHGSGLGMHLWVVDGCLALLHWFRRLRIRWKIRDDIHEAFLAIGCSLVCWRRLKHNSIC